MNDLSFSLRPAASDLFRFIHLKEVLEIRQGKIPAALAHKYHFNNEQWRELANAVVLTKLTQFYLSSHLSNQCLLHLQKIAASALQLPSSSLDDLYRTVQHEAPNLAAWLLRLKKLLGQ